MSNVPPHRARRARLATPLLACLLAALALPVRADLVFVWHDRFAPAERAKLTAWLSETFGAVERLVGELPMPVRAHLHRRDGAREPVPWANTQRFGAQGVHFHVDPRYPLEDFRKDWTAPHEFSHLILPYVGRRHAWFAEGFASYMQYPVMQTIGVLTPEQAASRYLRNLERAARDYAYPRQPFVEAAPKLRSERRFAVMYWGGAAYFMQVNQSLVRADSTLMAVLRRYVRCCRRDRAELASLLAELDRLSPTPAFRERYRRLASEPGFPEFPSGPELGDVDDGRGNAKNALHQVQPRPALQQMSLLH